MLLDSVFELWLIRGWNTWMLDHGVVLPNEGFSVCRQDSDPDHFTRVI